jgi:hypothetical protein
LDDWARQAILVEDQPSANFSNVVLELCKAVESEVTIRLGGINGLEFLAAERPLGDKARSLSRKIFDRDMKQRIAFLGIKAGFVTHDLQKHLTELANLRAATGTAHGNAHIMSAEAKDAKKARLLVAKILRGISPAIESNR